MCVYLKPGAGFPRDRRIPYHMPGLMDALRTFGVRLSIVSFFFGIQGFAFFFRLDTKGKPIGERGLLRKRWDSSSLLPSFMVSFDHLQISYKVLLFFPNLSEKQNLSC